MDNRIIHLATFLLAIKRRARRLEGGRRPQARARDEALRFVAEHPDIPEAKILARIVAAIDSGAGEFFESEVHALSALSLRLAAAMINSAVEGL